MRIATVNTKYNEDIQDEHAPLKAKQNDVDQEEYIVYAHMMYKILKAN